MEKRQYGTRMRFFRVYDDQERPIAAFYLDRTADRPRSAVVRGWMNASGAAGFSLPPGQTVRLPVAYLICNQTPPVDGKPSLMSFNEVKTLFHEFGHGLHHMLTTVDYGLAAGIHNVEWDAVELPSQFMENWCYHRETLMGMSAHVETGKPLPEELYHKLCTARTYRAGSLMLRQLYFACLDIALHHHFDLQGSKPHSSSACCSADHRAAAFAGRPFPVQLRAHLCRGYAAGYYSCVWPRC